MRTKPVFTLPSSPRTHARPGLHPRRRLAATALAATAAVSLLAACGGTSGTATTSTSPATTGATAGAVALTVRDAWVKTADQGMTAVFGVLQNTGSTPVTVTAADTTVADHTELHETVTKDGVTQMQQKQDGFTIAPGGEQRLQPGGDHIMLMGLKSPIRPGDQVTVTLHLSGGATATLTAIGKQTGAGAENYPSTSPTMSVDHTMSTGPTMSTEHK